MGELPDWYPLVRAAHYYGVGPWELLERPRAWVDWARQAESALNEAQEQARKRAWNE